MLTESRGFCIRDILLQSVYSMDNGPSDNQNHPKISCADLHGISNIKTGRVFKTILVGA